MTKPQPPIDKKAVLLMAALMSVMCGAIIFGVNTIERNGKGKDYGTR